MDPEHWWRDRDDLRFTLFEYQKLALYWLRIARLKLKVESAELTVEVRSSKFS